MRKEEEVTALRYAENVVVSRSVAPILGCFPYYSDDTPFVPKTRKKER